MQLVQETKPLYFGVNLAAAAAAAFPGIHCFAEGLLFHQVSPPKNLTQTSLRFFLLLEDKVCCRHCRCRRCLCHCRCHRRRRLRCRLGRIKRQIRYLPKQLFTLPLSFFSICEKESMTYFPTLLVFLFLAFQPTRKRQTKAVRRKNYGPVAVLIPFFRVMSYKPYSSKKLVCCIMASQLLY